MEECERLKYERNKAQTEQSANCIRLFTKSKPLYVCTIIKVVQK